MSNFYECTVSIKNSDTDKVPFRCTISSLSEQKKDKIENFFTSLLNELNEEEQEL